MRVFAIGDVHGHVDRLAALLDKAGALADDVERVYLGDVGHYGEDTPHRDLLTWQFVEKTGGTVLWGNHDYANMYPETHGFRGHVQWSPEVAAIVGRMNLQFAVERNGWLLTHAGLAPRFAPSDAVPLEMVASVINLSGDMPAINDISYRRGGAATQGGILWRDASEPLADIPQVFGHSRGDIRRFGKDQQSWCIDVGEREGDSLAGLWLQRPCPKIVAVGEEAGIYETPWEDSE